MAYGGPTSTSLAKVTASKSSPILVAHPPCSHYTRWNIDAILLRKIAIVGNAGSVFTTSFGPASTAAAKVNSGSILDPLHGDPSVYDPTK
jgi:hypothetical protein